MGIKKVYKVLVGKQKNCRGDLEVYKRRVEKSVPEIRKSVSEISSKRFFKP